MDITGLNLGGSLISEGDISVATQDTSAWDMSTLLPGDMFDNAKMQGSTVSVGDSATPWWQDVIQTGLTRIIDNTTGRTNVAGNTAPGSFAGANGRSYPQDVAKRPASQADGGDKGMGLLLLLGLGLLLVKA